MNSLERRAVGGLAVVYILRMLGLFMVFPVFALYAPQLQGATPTLVGLALGIYGLTQAVFQIPMGMFSDWLGRRRVATIGMLTFAAGSLLCMLADSMASMILGRALQGSGAVAAVLTAWLADLTREEVRPVAMMVVGISIGMSFVLSLVAGPLLYPLVGVPGIFALTAVLALVSVAALWLIVPDSSISHPHAPDRASLQTVLRSKPLLTLDVSVLALHAVLTACFVVIPQTLAAAALPSDAHWQVYLPAVLLSLPLSLIWIRRAGRRPDPSSMLLPVGLVCASAALLLLQTDVLAIVAVMFLFFVGFNFLEAGLPSWVAGVAPQDLRGAAMGVYSTSQFLGAFVGGLGGGWLYGLGGGSAVSGAVVVAGSLWLLGLRRFQPKASV